MKFITTTLTAVLASASLFSFAQKSVSVTIKDSTVEKRDTVADKPVITHHQVTVDGKTISYTAKAGYMPMRDAKDEKLIAKYFMWPIPLITTAKRNAR